MNLNELRQRQEQSAIATGLTLKDLLGKTSVLPLPAGLHECRIQEITSTESSKSFSMVVEKDIPAEMSKDGKTVITPATTAQYRINVNLGPTAESASMFMTTMSHLLDQIGLKSLDLDAMKQKKGETIVVLGTDRVTERGTFTNYSFNPAVMIAALK